MEVVDQRREELDLEEGGGTVVGSVLGQVLLSRW